jgi:hypothetical protein
VLPRIVIKHFIWIKCPIHAKSLLAIQINISLAGLEPAIPPVPSVLPICTVCSPESDFFPYELCIPHLFIAEVIQSPPKEEPKAKVTVIDLTLSDSEDEAEIPSKPNTAVKPDSSNQTVNSVSGTRLQSG